MTSQQAIDSLEADTIGGPEWCEAYAMAIESLRNEGELRLAVMVLLQGLDQYWANDRMDLIEKYRKLTFAQQAHQEHDAS